MFFLSLPPSLPLSLNLSKSLSISLSRSVSLCLWIVFRPKPTPAEHVVQWSIGKCQLVQLLQVCLSFTVNVTVALSGEDLGAESIYFCMSQEG